MMPTLYKHKSRSHNRTPVFETFLHIRSLALKLVSVFLDFSASSDAKISEKNHFAGVKLKRRIFSFSACCGSRLSVTKNIFKIIFCVRFLCIAKKVQKNKNAKKIKFEIPQTRSCALKILVENNQKILISFNELFAKKSICQRCESIRRQFIDLIDDFPNRWWHYGPHERLDNFFFLHLCVDDKRDVKKLMNMSGYAHFCFNLLWMLEFCV